MKHRHSGFTLVEVLIAVTLFSIMLGLLFATLQMAARNWEAGEVRADLVSSRLVVEGFLRRTLTSAFTWRGRPNDDEMGFDEGKNNYFKGTEASLEYIAALPLTLGIKGPQRFTLYLGQGQDSKKALKVKVDPMFGEASAKERKTRDLVLLENVAKLEFSYWQADRQNGGSWRDDWQEPGLPGAVKIQISTVKGLAWPPLVVDLRLQSGTGGFGGGGVWGGIRGD